MTGLISAIKRNEIHDGDGLRTTVFFKGCPLKCVWCHNPEGISFHSQFGFYAERCIGCGLCADRCSEGCITMADGKPVTDIDRCSGCLQCTQVCPTDARTPYGTRWEPEALAEKLMEDRLFFENSGGGVTLSGGECLSQGAFAIEVAKILWEKGISVDIDTCGFVRREVLDGIIPYTDTFLYDLKAIDSEVHRRCTGQDNSLILENLRYLCSRGCRVEIRYPYVPGYNGGECEKIGAFLAELPNITKVKVLGYHGYADGKYAALSMENTLPQVHVGVEDVEKAVVCLKRFGLPAVNGMVAD